MKLILIAAFFTLISIVLGCSLQNKTVAADAPQIVSEKVEQPEPAKNKTPVLVELFTSEGCSDCPPADGVLARLEREQPSADAEIITLALHADYWDRLGWKDSFSSHSFSERQESYGNKFKLDSIYTPQMIVDGEKEFVGSNFDTARNAVSDAAKNPKAKIEITPQSAQKNQNARLTLKITDLPAHENSDVWLVTAEDNLQTAVERGENRDKTLKHTSIAREMRIIGEVNSTAKTFNVETEYQIQPEWNRKNLKLIVFVQGKESKQVYAVNKINLP